MPSRQSRVGDGWGLGAQSLWGWHRMERWGSVGPTVQHAWEGGKPWGVT